VNTAVLTTHGLSKTYGSRPAVRNLDLEVRRGEVFGFLGPNGAGKTTTIRMALGLIRPTAGSVEILGHDVRREGARVLPRVGALVETPALYPYLSGRDNLKAFAYMLGGVPAARLDEVLELVGLAGRQKDRVRAYSLGMKQRLGVAIALLNDPELLVLDEPANGLDPAGIVEMRDLLRRLKGEGHTILISSHVLHEIEQVCDRIAILVKGTIRVQGPVHSLLSGGTSIKVRIDRAGEAEAILESVRWVSGVTRNGTLLLVTAPAERSAEINKILAEQGLFAAEITPQEQSLEQYFLEVTSGDSA
jgi:ABC-2 type transport system ATP-binding protein